MQLRSKALPSLLGFSVAVGAIGALLMPAHSDQLPSSQDSRAVGPPQNLDTPRVFPHFSTLAEWEKRRTEIRRQILVSCGLYPLPEKTPLKPHVFGRVERDGYTIEKVAIQTYPGFYLAGNLYRPHGTSITARKHPAVLIAHGHWSNGRMANEEAGSIPARAITFAREGVVAFTYDMVGYNDTHQIPHTFAGDRQHWVWGVSLMGLQTWNSIRALDFLIGLSDVDRSRLAITGESGGGTQTMILGAIDDRLAAVGPCVMVSHSMQGGCLCENAPGLRVEFSNMEIAACAAPKPQIMVAATGDWTKTMMTVEGPGVESVYKLYGKPENLKYVIFNYGHNINKTSREAVYQAFGKWLSNLPEADTLREAPYTMEPVDDLRVFPGADGLPKDAINADTLTAYLKRIAIDHVERAKPHDVQSLASFKKEFMPLWHQTLAIADPMPKVVERKSGSSDAAQSGHKMDIGREGGKDSIPAVLYEPAGNPASVVVLASPGGIHDYSGAGVSESGLVKGLLDDGNAVLIVECFLTGSVDPAVSAARHPGFGEYFDTYNRTDLQERVQDLVTAIHFMRHRYHKPVTVCGSGKAGLWAIMAAPVADGVAADTDEFDLTGDASLISDDMYVPCLRRFGDFRAASALAAPNPLALFHVSDKFTAAPWVRDVYQSLGAASLFTSSTGPMSEAAVRAVAIAARNRSAQ